MWDTQLTSRLLASIGPRVFTRGYPTLGLSYRFAVRGLQLGHGFLPVDTTTRRDGTRGVGHCFNWATGFYPWIQRDTGGVLMLTFLGFNWATGFYPWIHEIDTSPSASVWRLQLGHGFLPVDTWPGSGPGKVQMTASIGPRVFTRGYLTRRGTGTPAGHRLQLGHGFLPVDTSIDLILTDPPYGLLQLGHGFLPVDTCNDSMRGGVMHYASIGPRVFTRGYLDIRTH